MVFFDLLVVRQAEPKFRTLWRGRESRAEKIEPCVASAEGSTFLTHRPRPATQGSIFSARVAEGFDVFLPVYNAAPPVTASIKSPLLTTCRGYARPKLRTLCHTRVKTRTLRRQAGPSVKNSNPSVLPSCQKCSGSPATKKHFF